ncbi:hypothetical protein QVD17_30843 [Tagetes erecta]|uniref:Uncharacterized protein n=1 Tax=Tagetes erecta TaxID=13708 RepID=A0AAD8K4D8_TARER|nr:hypothetical protein QVD17_30843 [Tagetes erecta]
MTTVQSGNEHVKYSRVKVIDICRVTSCVTIQPGEEMLSLYSRVKEKSYLAVQLCCCVKKKACRVKKTTVLPGDEERMPDDVLKTTILPGDE